MKAVADKPIYWSTKKTLPQSLRAERSNPLPFRYDNMQIAPSPCGLLAMTFPISSLAALTHHWHILHPSLKKL